MLLRQIAHDMLLRFEPKTLDIKKEKKDTKKETETKKTLKMDDFERKTNRKKELHQPNVQQYFCKLFFLKPDSAAHFPKQKHKMNYH